MSIFSKWPPILKTVAKMSSKMAAKKKKIENYSKCSLVIINGQFEGFDIFRSKMADFF